MGFAIVSLHHLFVCSFRPLIPQNDFLGRMITSDQTEKDSTAIQQSRSPDTKIKGTEKPFNFLKLPGEIRNQIYNSVFEPQDYELNWLAKKKDLTYRVHESRPTPEDAAKDWKLHRQLLSQRSPNITLRRRQLDLPRRLKSPEPEKPPYELSPGPAALLLTCRQIHSEANAIFYGNHTFHFSSSGIFVKFLDSLTAESKAAIKALSFYYRPDTLEYMRARPEDSEGSRWIYNSSPLWTRACNRITREITGLEELSLRVWYDGIPACYFQDSWVRPWLAFRKSGLRRIQITGEHNVVRNWDISMIFHGWGEPYNDTILEQLTRELETFWPTQVSINP